MESSRALDLVRSLDLTPHPEGGYYREIIRTASLTSIYFLLVAPHHSRWHRVASDEVWHFYDGDPLELTTIDPVALRVERIALGGLHRAHVVPAHWWQAARTSGEVSLVGCTVAPPFQFADFALLSDVPHELRRIRSSFLGVDRLL